jgi:JmjC domain
VRADEKLSTSDYTVDVPWRPDPFRRTADVPRVLREWERGATIVVQGLHHWWPPLAAFCRALEGALGHPAQANAYSTPKAAQGLPVHHDTHDVFSLQVAGEKRWLAYEPVWELPLPDQKYRAELGAPGEPVLDVTLRAGDTLYLPRGWLHQALTSDADSLHLTIGLKVATWIDAFKAALAECGEDVEFRRAPVGSAQPLLERLAAHLSPDDVSRRLRDKLVRTRRPVLDGQLAQLRALDELDLDTVLERRPTVLFDLRVTADGGVAISFEGRRVEFPAHARAEVEALAFADEPFEPADLPGDLDAQGRLVLCRRLVREGFLRIAALPPDGR